MFRLLKRPLAVTAIVALSMVSTAGPVNATPGHQDEGLAVLTPVAQDIGRSIAKSPGVDHRGEAKREVPLAKGSSGGGRPEPGGRADGALRLFS